MTILNIQGRRNKTNDAQLPRFSSLVSKMFPNKNRREDYGWGGTVFSSFTIREKLFLPISLYTILYLFLIFLHFPVHTVSRKNVFIQTKQKLKKADNYNTFYFTFI